MDLHDAIARTRQVAKDRRAAGAVLVADAVEMVVAELDATSGGEPAGYVIAGYEIAGDRAGRLVADWDAEVHVTREQGAAELAKCHESGYRDWQLYALRPVSRETAF